MAENKRFYWLKLQENFFEDDTIRFIEEQENGIKYSNFYLKLCLKSLRTEGKLIRIVGETLIPYDVKSLSSLTGVDVDTVRCAMALFEKIGCVKVLDSGELFISQLSELVGSETDKAKLMRISRAKKNDAVTLLPERYPEYRDKRLELELELEKERESKGAKAPTLEKAEKVKFGEYGWVRLTNDEHSRLVSEFGETTVKSAIRYIDESAQSTGNKNKWKDWNLVVRRCIREGWGKRRTEASGGNIFSEMLEEERRLKHGS